MLVQHEPNPRLFQNNKSSQDDVIHNKVIKFIRDTQIPSIKTIPMSIKIKFSNKRVSNLNSTKLTFRAERNRHSAQRNAKLQISITECS